MDVSPRSPQCFTSKWPLTSKSDFQQGPGPPERQTLLRTAESHSLQLLAALRSFRECSLMFDFTINVAGRAFPCHRCVLAASSDFFRAMFEVDMLERGDGSVTLDDQCLDAVSAFLDFAYSGEILITNGNIDTLFQLAAFLQVSVLLRACTEFLIGSLDLSNCLYLISIAEAYGSDSLLQSANDFVVQNFCDLSKTQDFLNMQESEACCTLISQAQDQQEQHSGLHTDARPATTQSYIYIHKTEENGETRHAFCYSMLKARTMHAAVTCLDRVYVIGGRTRGSTGEAPSLVEVEYYNPLTKTWCSVSPLPTAIFYPEATSCGSLIYTLGSEVEFTETFNPLLDCFFCYDAQKDQWNRLVAEFGQFFHAILVKAVSNNDTLHLCDLSTYKVYSFCPETCVWKGQGSFECAGFNAGAVGTRDRIYILGGDYSPDEITDDVQVYHSERSEWEELSPMPRALTEFHCQLISFTRHRDPWDATL
ncbi:BTB domain-containing protein 3 [Takifugu flavidus]|uniref:BTB domain-containing protein 3 n=1 Tax=Takifugu flavidus TaxID=433684 RepID=A0A5C6PDT7_9TELE|nr:BTB domain-containing protein 3 [Takifugu flavidus]